MRKYLLSPGGPGYKANLHCHSVLSDGRATPEEMKAHYMEKGYQILSITDHELLVLHNDLNEEGFLLIPGSEYAFCEDKPYIQARTVELNIYPRDPTNDVQVCFAGKYLSQRHQWRAGSVRRIGENFERDFSLECMQTVIDAARANDCIVSLNHPCFSRVEPMFFGRLRGLFAMEMVNQGAFYTYSDYNPFLYDEMLRMGHRIGVTGSDDAHSLSVYDEPSDPRPYGTTRIRAKELTHAAVIDAMERGDMYCTTGPLIDELYIEDGQVHVTCSEVKTVVLVTGYRRSRVLQAPVGKTLTEAVFDIPPDGLFFRIQLIDAYGRRADTKGYFMDEVGLSPKGEQTVPAVF